MIGGLFALFYFLTQSTIEPVAAMAFWLAYINVALAVFNLIPGFPLDGGRVFRSFLWGITGNYKRSTRIATQVGQGMGYLFILGGILIMFILHDWLGGLWLAFIGWFLRNAASLSYRQAQWREGLHRFTASEVMTSDCPVVLPSDSVDQLIQGYAFATGHRCFLVAENDRLMGMLTLHDTKTASQPNRRVTQVKEIMTPVDRLKVAHPDQDALSLLEQMGESNLNQMPVVSEGRVIGLVARHNLIRFLGIHPQPGSAS
jgi:CBS domain-containing protein